MKKYLFLNIMILLFLGIFSKLNATEQLRIENNTEENIFYEIDHVEKKQPFSNVTIRRLCYGRVKPESVFISQEYEKIIRYDVVGNRIKTGYGSADLVFNEQNICVIQ